MSWSISSIQLSLIIWAMLSDVKLNYQYQYTMQTLGYVRQAVPSCTAPSQRTYWAHHAPRLQYRCKNVIMFSIFSQKRVFNVSFNSATRFFIFRVTTRYLRIISCETVKRKHTELSIRANIYLSIFNIGSVEHWLNYSIKVSVLTLSTLPMSRSLRYCFISCFSIGSK